MPSRCYDVVFPKAEGYTDDLVLADQIAPQFNYYNTIQNFFQNLVEIKDLTETSTRYLGTSLEEA